LIAVLCKKGVIPPEICRLKGHGGGPEFGPLGVTPSLPAPPPPPITIVLPTTVADHEDVAGPGRGHTRAKHVGKSDTFLKDRLKHENIPAATSFHDEAKASDAMTTVLRANKAMFEADLNAGKPSVGWAPVAGAGYGIRRPPPPNDRDPAAIDAQPRVFNFPRARVVARPGGPRRWYVVTSHPDD
jgi:hypothetical protein